MFEQSIETATNTLLVQKIANYMFTIPNCVFMSDVIGCYTHLSKCLQHLIWNFVWDILGAINR